ncbi:MAG: dual specificity protein phosphatase family protein [Endomicrobiales bacterium]|nr:dual specificity protein phosphatase family protein [Endomicrobiales bacterium]
MKNFRKYTISVFCVFFVCVGGYYAYSTLTGNFHVITPGEAYRSAQLGTDRLGQVAEKYGIKSVINLRGEKHGEEWYENEKAVCERRQIQHFSIKLTAANRPSKDDVSKLLYFFSVAQRPVLIHCHGGADRAGFAAALWKIVVDKAPKEEAKKQLSIFYGHRPWGSEQVLDEYIDEWEPGRFKELGAVTEVNQ